MTTDGWTHDLTYPISPSYVKDWTPVRAIAELIANALDEGVGVSVEWSDGHLVIADEGPGIPEEGLVLGASTKGDDKIGQWGEGAKLGALVLARSPEVGSVVVETVGYGFEPVIESLSLLGGLARRTKEATELLVYRLHGNQRTRGTVVSIECTEELAAEARARFLHFSGGYTPPSGAGQVITTGAPGRFYIGGVLVQEAQLDSRFAYSYDFSLAAAKSLQNRDRNVIDGWVLQDLVARVWTGVEDLELLGEFVQRALDGRIGDAENVFGRMRNYETRVRFHAVRKRIFGERRMFYGRPGSEEATLAIADRGYEQVKCKLNGSEQQSLMVLLGIPAASELYRQAARKREQTTTWVKRSALTADERASLDRAVRIVRALWGAEAIDRIDAFSETSQLVNETEWGGFYDPRTQRIAVARAVLADEAQTLGVVTHEAAHRLAHLAGGEFGDRSRGFETMLDTMAARAAARLDAAGLLADEAPDLRSPSVAVAALVTDRMHALGHRSAASLVRGTPLPASYVSRLRSGKPFNGPERIRRIADALGMSWSVLWLASAGTILPFVYKSAGSKNRRWHANALAELVPALAELRALGGAFAAAADVIEEMASGRVAVSQADTGWHQVYLDLVDAERERLGL